ncbi:hypothetical protein ACFQZZ_08475 [Nocardia sp. GCM10030253]|uniref:hypothetical protein n=1 Tax=Nocardia sp. GCM10030253 TaxID=3273404 RepID=UPI00364186F5
MGTHPHKTPTRPFYVRAASFVVAGALPLSLAVIGTGTATADQQLPADATIIQTPYGPAIVGNSTAFGSITAAALFDAPSADARVATSIADTAVEPHILPASDLTAPTPSVAPIEAADDRIRFGHLEVDRPEWLNPDQSAQINDAAANTQAAVAQALASAGIDEARSERIADHALGGAAVGAVVGTVLASPISVTGAVIGVVAGLVAGLPFAPIGLVIVPPIGAALGFAMASAPFTAAGAAVGAAIGAAEGYFAPEPVTVEQPSTLP